MSALCNVPFIDAINTLNKIYNGVTKFIYDHMIEHRYPIQDKGIRFGFLTINEEEKCLQCELLTYDFTGRLKNLPSYKIALNTLPVSINLEDIYKE